ncbi:Ku protein [Murimonas intestini]|uniref:non-homologous end joining protein Ku n=1 Tax=Murimonas intestini TaxID=1337051 RepID=UPI00248B2677|nr:Ku protein [Murimonas intestini]
MAAQKAAISFGLVHIPVALHTATQDSDIHFNQLCKEDGSRVKYKKVCANCGKEVGTEDIVKGFEFAPGQYVTMTDADFEKAKTEKDRTIQILHFADLSTIPPVYYDKTYHAIPEVGGDKAYELLRRVMYEEKKVAIAKTVLGQTEKLLALIPTADEILFETMFFADEIKELPKEIVHPELNEQEMNMAKTLVNSMVQNFQPEIYHNEYQKRLREIIEAKINGQEITIAPEEKKSNVIDLMEALQASLNQMGGQNPPKKRRGRKASA